MLRIGLFIATNLAVLFVLNLIITLPGIESTRDELDATDHTGGRHGYGRVIHIPVDVKKNGQAFRWRRGHRFTHK